MNIVTNDIECVICVLCNMLYQYGCMYVTEFKVLQCCDGYDFGCG